MLLLAVMGATSPLAVAAPLMLLGLGHGFLMPTTLAGTVGVLPALAGAAAAVAGMSQQLMGAVAGWAVGLVPHQTALPLGLLMLGFTLCAMASQGALRRSGAS
jgi:DHA1 family bicyclomycin/chloramphenicol resistance-like MFS transporter